MQQSIYHIENDIDCRVLKFGKDICTAIAGEDSIINLCKGRHKLSFINTENECDVYSMILEVPENGIEDFIEVELSPIRNARLERETRELEAEHERLAAFERRRLEEEPARQEQLAREELEEFNENKVDNSLEKASSSKFTGVFSPLFTLSKKPKASSISDTLTRQITGEVKKK